MTEIVFAYEELSLEDETIPVYVSSDHRLFVCFADLCDLLALDWKIQHLYLMTDPYLKEQLALFNRNGLGSNSRRRRDTTFFDLAALSYWLGTLTRRHIQSRKTQERVTRFTLKYATFSWELMDRGFVPVRKKLPSKLPTERVPFSEN